MITKSYQLLSQWYNTYSLARMPCSIQKIHVTGGHPIFLIISSHCAAVATVHPDAGQPVYRDAPGNIS